MPTYHFLARVRPLGAVIRLETSHPPDEIRFTVAGIDNQHILRVFVSGPNVVLEVTTKDPIQEIGRLHNHVEELGRALFDSVCYGTGWAIDIEITGVLTEDRGLLRFEARSDGLIRQAEAEAKQEAFDAWGMFVLAVQSRPMRRALADLNRAVALPGDAALYAYRAVEGIMQNFRQENGEKKEAWARLRSALNVGQSYLLEMTGPSKDTRHGSPRQMTVDQRDDLILRARTVIQRFAAFLRSDQKPLDPAQFPRLD